MADLAQLEAHTRELSTMIQSLTMHCQHAPVPMDSSINGNPPQLIPPGAPEEAHRVRESVLASISRLSIMLAGPTDFLQQMASQVYILRAPKRTQNGLDWLIALYQTQILACIQWLGEFQIPACIPLDCSVFTKDIADLAGVSETLLCRIVRMVTPTGFLQEPQPGCIAHTALSASFVMEPAYLDSAMFLAGTAGPGALQMAAATRQDSGQPFELMSSNVNHAISSNGSAFSNAGETQSRQPPRLQRQWHAYLRYGTGYVCDTATDILTCLEPLRMGNASIVEVGARSTERAMALANQYPALHFTVQLNTNTASRSKVHKTRHPRITVQHRVLGTTQPIQDAAVYILNLPFPAQLEASPKPTPLAEQIQAELKAHLNALRTSRSAIMVLTGPSWSESERGAGTGTGSAETQTAMLPRLRELSLLQLTNERMLERPEVMHLVNGVGDGEGRLVWVNTVRSVGSNGNGTVAMEVKYQTYADS